MATSIKNLIFELETRPQDQEVEFVILGTDGELVLVDLQAQGEEAIRLLKMLVG